MSVTGDAAAMPADPASNGTPASQTARQTPVTKRPLDDIKSPNTEESLSKMPHIVDNLDDIEPPEGTDPWICKMLIRIDNNTNDLKNRVTHLDQRVASLEDKGEHDQYNISELTKKMGEVLECNRTLMGRVIRAEAKLERQQAEIVDLRARSMRDNIIIKTTGEKYKENINENTAAIFRKFLGDEMRVANADHIQIPRAHRMGTRYEDRNRMMIAKVVSDDDQKRIFSNVKSLKNTNYAISKQIPIEQEERRQFAWADFKKARDNRQRPRFEGGKLFVDNNHVPKFDAVSLPTLSATLVGSDAVVPCGKSDRKEANGHVFRAWAVGAKNLQDVRDGLDRLLQDDAVSSATHIPYAFSLPGENGRNTLDNFESDSDFGAGLQILRAIRANHASGTAVFVTHMQPASRAPLSGRARQQCIDFVVSGALLALDIAQKATDKD